MSATTDASPLPLAPLTAAALNARTRELLDCIAWKVAAEVALGRKIDTARLRVLGERLNVVHNAAVVRAELQGPAR